MYWSPDADSMGFTLPSPGDELDEAAEERLRELDAGYRAWQVAVRLCARAEQCETILRAKLAARGFSSRAIDAALRRAIAESYVDDRRFAAAWMRSRLSRHAEGPRRVEAALRAKGIAREIVREALDGCFSADVELELARKALAKPRGLAYAEYRSFLLDQGFTAECISRLLEEMR
jgi:regulatory protein